jgi:small-conductance mechanosensitive channel
LIDLAALVATLQFKLLLLAVITAGLVAALMLTSRFILGHSRLSPHLRRSVMLTMGGPVSALVVGLAVISMLRLSAAYIPPPLTVEELTLLVELAVMAVVVRTAGLVAKHVMAHVTGKEGFEREIVYAVYALGFIAVVYALLSAPGSPIVVGGIWQVIGFVAGLTITYLVSYVVSGVTRRYSEALFERDPQLRTTVTFVRRLVISLIVLVGVGATTFIIIPSAGAAVASIFVAAGFASIVVGLAAQSTLANIFAGMIVSTAQPFRIGDALLFSNEWAWVEDIRLSFTILKTWDNRRLVVPNQLFLGQTLVNYDLNDSSKLVVVFIQVPYDTDLDRAIELMKKAAREHPDFLPAGNLPVVHVMEYNESGISLRLLGNAKDQPTAFQMSKDLLYTIRREFMAAGIQISYPTREVVFREPGGKEKVFGRNSGEE